MRTRTEGGMLTKDRKAVLMEKLVERIQNISVFGLKYVRHQYSPGDMFCHLIYDDDQGGRHYLEVKLTEKV